MNPNDEIGSKDGFPDPKRAERLVTRADRWIILAFALFAIFFFIDRFRGMTPFVALGGDAANLASFAAALDHPELFVGDEALGNPANFKFYGTFHVPLLRWLVVPFGDYGTAFIALLPFHVFFQLLGFYVLGRLIFQSRYWAVLLAAINTGLVWVGYGTYWGIYEDPQSRFSFQAILPFLLAAALAWRSEPRRWPWLMVGAGLLMYVHPVSAPTWAFALWLSLVFARPAERDRWSHAAYMLALGFLFLLVSCPYILNYILNHAHGEVEGLKYEKVYTVMHEFYGRDLLNIPNGLRRFAMRWLWARSLFWLLAVAGAGFLLVFCARHRTRAGMVINWVSGVAFISAIVPYVEQEICRALEVIPLEMNLGRGIRYLVPLMLLFCLWVLVAVEEKWARSPTRLLAVRGFGILLVGIWLFWHPPVRIQPWAECWRDGRLICHPEIWDERLELLDAVRLNTAPGSRILPAELGLELRYYSLRPVVFAPKDKFLSYVNHAAFLTWYELNRRVSTTREIEDRDERFAAWRGLGADQEADYLVLDVADLPVGSRQGPLWQVVWENRRFALVRLSDE